MSSVPPFPVVVLKTLVKLVPLSDTWIWYALAHELSQTRDPLLILSFLPRSTRIHCGSTLDLLFHRVAALPSTAFLAAKVALLSVEASTGRPWETIGSAADATLAMANCMPIRAATAATPTATPGRTCRICLNLRRTGPPGRARAFG